jgi:hypothetical protein
MQFIPQKSWFVCSCVRQMHGHKNGVNDDLIWTHCITFTAPINPWQNFAHNERNWSSLFHILSSGFCPPDDMVYT